MSSSCFVSVHRHLVKSLKSRSTTKRQLQKVQSKLLLLLSLSSFASTPPKFSFRCVVVGRRLSCFFRLALATPRLSHGTQTPTTPCGRESSARAFLLFIFCNRRERRKFYFGGLEIQWHGGSCTFLWQSRLFLFFSCSLGLTTQRALVAVRSGGVFGNAHAFNSTHYLYAANRALDLASFSVCVWLRFSEPPLARISLLLRGNYELSKLTMWFLEATPATSSMECTL